MTSTVVWSDHASILFHGIASLYESGSLSDLVIKCHDREFKVHKFVLNLFTDYFTTVDGVWIRINTPPSHMEKMLFFMYHGQVNIDYEEMEGFLHSCKQLSIKLFKDAAVPDYPPPVVVGEGERYEMNNFQLMCKNCYKVFPDEKVLKKHTWGCTRPRNFKCRFCDKSFRHKNDIQNHERFHTGEKPFSCGECGKTFTLKCTMIEHIKSKHENIRYRCEHCNHVLNTKMALKTHMGTKHATIKPFACGACGDCFALQSLLTAHMNAKHKAARMKQRHNVARQQRGSVPVTMAAENNGVTEMIVVNTEEGEDDDMEEEEDDDEEGTVTTSVQLQVDETGNVTFKTD